MKRPSALSKSIGAIRVRSLGLLASTLFVGSLSAQVSVTNSTGASFNFSSNLVSFNYDVVNPNSVLVIGMYLDTTTTISGVTFGGQAPAQSLQSDRSRLFYFTNPTTSPASFTASSTTASQTNGGNAYFIWELAGVDLIAPVATATGTSGSTTITTTAANSFITGFFSFNNSGVGTVPDGNSVLIKRGDVDANSSLGGGYIAAGDVTAGAAGIYNLGWTPAGGGFQYGEAAFAFVPTAVPEPASAAVLMGLVASAAFCTRRRRSSR